MSLSLYMVITPYPLTLHSGDISGTKPSSITVNPGDTFVGENNDAAIINLLNEGAIRHAGLLRADYNPQIKTKRVSTVVNPGVTEIDLVWDTPFKDNNYFVTFPNPPFAPSSILTQPTALTKTDSFNTTLDTAWVSTFGTFDIDAILHSLKVATTDVNNRAAMGFIDAGWSLNQYSQLKITQLELDGGGLGPAVYVHGASYYALYIDSGTTYLFKQVGPITTVIATASATLLVNDILRLEIATNTLVSYHNDNILLVSFELVPLPKGAPGVQGYKLSDPRSNNWEGGNLTNIPEVITPVVIGPWTYLSDGRGIKMFLNNLNTNPLDTLIDIIGIE